MRIFNEIKNWLTEGMNPSCLGPHHVAFDPSRGHRLGQNLHSSADADDANFSTNPQKNAASAMGFEGPTVFLSEILVPKTNATPRSVVCVCPKEISISMCPFRSSSLHTEFLFTGRCGITAHANSSRDPGSDNQTAVGRGFRRRPAGRTRSSCKW